MRDVLSWIMDVLIVGLGTTIAYLSWRVNRPRVDRVLKAVVRERFVVTMSSGETFSGLLNGFDRRTVVLVDAAQLATGGNRIPVDGWLYLPRDQIAYMQRPN